MNTMSWQRIRNILAFPHGWQTPAITEQHAYKRVCEALPDVPHVAYVAFPWATVIDFLQTGQHDKAKSYLDKLKDIPAHDAGIRITVAQHIYSARFIELFESVGITDLFWSHTTVNSDRINNIQLHPFPLYPVRCLDVVDRVLKPYYERKFLYSFVGAYDPQHYISKSRVWISQLSNSDEGLIQLTKEWHFNSDVYEKQIFHHVVDPAKMAQVDKRAEEYGRILADTVFSLCPSGSGPNSIRLWESLGFGCIPVIIADTLKLPGELGEWQKAAIFVTEEETPISKLPATLKYFVNDRKKMISLFEAGQVLWKKYGFSNFIHDLKTFVYESSKSPVIYKQSSYTMPSNQTCRVHAELNMAKISIVTPSYNQVEYLEECIDSILSQNYPNLEYIIIDGGSTDGSVEIIKKYEKYLTYWQSQSDGGQYAAINEGFRRSTGEIMTWLNSDDKFHHGSFAAVAELFKQHLNVAWIMGRPNGFDHNGKQSWIYDALPLWNREKYLRKEYKNPYIQQEGTFWRRSLWDRAGGYVRSDLRFAGDLELWTRFFRHAQLHTVDILLAGYRQHPKQKMATFLEQYHQEADQVLEQEQNLFWNTDDKTLLPPPPPIYLSKGAGTVAMSEDSPRVSVHNFQEFTYSRRTHFSLLSAEGIDPDTCDLKVIQDLLVIQFILGNIQPGSRLLEVGGGPYSRVIELLKDRYEIWNLDENLEEVPKGYQSVMGLLGEMNPQLPQKYFDCVFSISALEHVPENTCIFDNICQDIGRVLKPGGFSIHSFDIIAKRDSVWTSGLLPYMFLNFQTINKPIFFDEMCRDPDLYVMSESAYDKGWIQTTKRSYGEFGRPLAYNVLWQKTGGHISDSNSCISLPESLWNEYLQRLKKLWLSRNMIPENNSEGNKLLRSNLQYWKNIQAKGYFENHPCYQGNLVAGDEKETIARYLELLPNMNVVVIGCGYGRETTFIAPYVQRVYGIDVNEKILSTAVDFLASRNIHNFQPVMADNWQQSVPTGIDFVFCVVVFQHLTKDLVRDYIFGLAKKLSPDGRFLCQFAELVNSTHDAELMEYEPNVRWTESEIEALVKQSGLTLYRLDTVEKPGFGYWHWAFFGR